MTCTNNIRSNYSQTSYSRKGLTHLKSTVANDDSPPIDDPPVFEPSRTSEVDDALPQLTIDLLPTAEPTDSPDDEDLSIAGFDGADLDDTDR